MSIVGVWKKRSWGCVDGQELGIGSIRIDNETGYIEHCVTAEHIEDCDQPFEEGELVEMLVRRKKN